MTSEIEKRLLAIKCSECPMDKNMCDCESTYNSMFKGVEILRDLLVEKNICKIEDIEQFMDNKKS